jgi:hypothetical protein
MHPDGVSVVLSPFIATLADGVTAALRELLGIPRTWRSRGTTSG